MHVCSFRVSSIWHIWLSASSGDQITFEFGADVMKPLQGRHWSHISTYVEVKGRLQPSNPLRTSLDLTACEYIYEKIIFFISSVHSVLCFTAASYICPEIKKSHCALAINNIHIVYVMLLSIHWKGTSRLYRTFADKYGGVDFCWGCKWWPCFQTENLSSWFLTEQCDAHVILIVTTTNRLQRRAPWRHFSSLRHWE